MRRYTVTLTTNGSGVAEGYTPKLRGKVHDIQYVKTDFANGADVAITGETTGRNIWTQSDVNASVQVAPRQPTHTQAGVARVYASTDGVADKIAVSGERIKIAIAQGGDTKVGTFHILVG